MERKRIKNVSSFIIILFIYPLSSFAQNTHNISDINLFDNYFFQSEQNNKYFAFSKNQQFEITPHGLKIFVWNAVKNSFCEPVELYFINNESTFIFESEKSDISYSYYSGNDPSKWIINSYACKRLCIPNVYKGIDLEVYFKGYELEFDFIVSAKADINQIIWEIRGNVDSYIEKDKLVLVNNEGYIYSFSIPEIYTSSSKFSNTLLSKNAYFLNLNRNLYQIFIDNFDRNSELIIDPILVLSSYMMLPNSAKPTTLFNRTCIDYYNSITDIALTGGSIQHYGTSGLTVSAFVSKLSPKLGKTHTIAFIDGKNDDYINAIAHYNDLIIIGGKTNSDDFPLKNPIQPMSTKLNTNGIIDASDGFITILDKDMRLYLFSTYIGGTGNDSIEDITINSDMLFFAGNTSSTDLPLTTSPAYKESVSDGFWGILNLSPSYEYHYISKLNLDGIEVKDIEVNASKVYLCGNTTVGVPYFSPLIPESSVRKTDIFFQSYSYSEGIVNLLSSYFIGGSEDDILEGCVFIPPNILCLAGNTYSRDISGPIISSIPEKQGTSVPFLSFMEDASSRILGTYYVFGNRTDVLTDIKSTPNNPDFFFISGYTNSDFGTFEWNNILFTSNPFNNQLNNGLSSENLDAMIWRFLWNSDENTFYFTWGTFLGGSSNDTALSIGVADENHICVSGITNSTDFPVRGCHSVGEAYLPSHYISAFNIPGKIIYVNPSSTDTSPDGSSWEKGFHTISEAINSANDYDEIWIRKGEYNEILSISELSHIVIRGGFSGNEIDINDTNMFENPTKIHVVPNKAVGDLGTPILNITGSYSVAIIGLIFENGNNIFNNGGAINISNSLVYLSCCQFYNNTAYGNGGAVFADTSEVNFTNCVFAKNSCQGEGSAIFANESSLQITHCTFADNKKIPGGETSTVNVEGSTSIFGILNSIIWAKQGNNTPQIHYAENILFEYSSLSHSIIQNFSKLSPSVPSILAIDTVLDTEPLFIEYPSETSIGNLNLTLNSPAVNLGDPTSLNIEYGAVTEDIRRKPRMLRGNICKPDAGAFEIYPAPPPQITLLGDNPLYLQLNEPYIEPGYKAVDGCGVDISDLVESDITNLDTSKEGEYLVGYKVLNPYNQQEPVIATRRVIVQKNVNNAQITILGSPTITLECGEIFTDPGATAKDPSGNDITSQIEISGEVNNTSPGTYEIMYRVIATETYGPDTKTRTVKVQDTTPPDIKLKGNPVINLRCGDIWSDPGYSASDSCSQNVSVTISGSVDTSKMGQYILTYIAMDTSENQNSVKRTVIVDCTLPITLIGSATVTVPCDTPFNDPGYYVPYTDVISPVTINITGTVNTSQTGRYILTYTASDTLGNQGSVQRTVIVDCNIPVFEQCQNSCINNQENLIDNDGDGLSLCVEKCFGTYDISVDSDTDGMSDDFEVSYSLNPLQNDSIEDADLDGITNLEEYLQKTNPKDYNSPWRSYYVSPTGNNISSGGTPSNPWATIEYAISKITSQTTQKISVILLPGNYNENIVLKSNIILRGITVSAAKQKPTIYGTIKGADNTGIMGIDVRPPSPSKPDYILLDCGNNTMHIKNVNFIGTGLETGIAVDGEKPYYSIIEQSTFENLRIGIRIGDSIPLIRRCIFRNTIITRSDKSANTPVGIYIEDNPGSTNPSNSLGDAKDPNTGWNTFEMGSGKAVLNERSTPISAQNNDWGVDENISPETVIEGNLDFSSPLKKGKALVASSLSCVVWNANNKQPVLNATISLNPAVYPPLTQNTNGVYTFASLPEGTYTVNVSASGFQNHSLSTTVPSGQIKSESIALKSASTQEGSNDGHNEGSGDGSTEGSGDGSTEGSTEGAKDGTVDGTKEGQSTEGENNNGNGKKCGCGKKNDRISMAEIGIIVLTISLLGMYRPKRKK